MKHFNFYLLAICLSAVALSNVQAQKIKNNLGYFSKPSRVGILIQTNADVMKADNGGLIGAAISLSRSTSKYDTAMSVIGPVLNPLEQMKETYTTLYTQLGKQVTFIDKPLDSLAVKNFRGFDEENNYYKKYVGPIREKFQIDELIILSVKYGMKVEYSYGVGHTRLGACYIQTEVVRLQDNSYIIKDYSYESRKIQGDWDTPPAFENLKASTHNAIQAAIQEDTAKYQKK